MCGAIGEPPGPSWPKAGDMRLNENSDIERWTGNDWVDGRSAIDWDRIERFVVTTRVDGGHQSQSVGKGAVTAVLKDGYTVERYRPADVLSDDFVLETFDSEPRDPDRRWTEGWLREIIREEIEADNIRSSQRDRDTIERELRTWSDKLAPIERMSGEAGDATDDESRPLTPGTTNDGSERSWTTRRINGIDWDIDTNLPVWTRDLLELGESWLVVRLKGRTLREIIENFAEGYGRTEQGE